MQTMKHLYWTMLALGSVGGLAVAACSESGDATLTNSESDVASATSALSSAAEAAVKDSYIVVFKPGVVSSAQVADTAAQLATAHGGKVTHQYKYALQGAAMKLTAEQRAAMAKDSRVSYIVPDGIATAVATQTNPPWGLDRIDQSNLPLNQTYTYADQAGQGVNVYVIDTGINASHTDFSGRVGAGYDYVDGDSNPDDCHGHGTHVSGTIGGTTYGVAKKVTLHAVRVLDCNGSGTYANVIAGIDWVRLNRSGASVANMSLGGGFNQAVNDAVTNAIASGVTFAVAAGNSNADACSYSPSSTPNALTVGATDSTDARASYSNYGTCLDIFAPGSSILSAWIGSTTATNTISGTSMASPHVAGAAALYLGTNPSATPAQVGSALIAAATSGVVTNPGTGSPNRLLKTTSGGSVSSWTLKYSWSGAAACAAGTATYSSVAIDMGVGPNAANSGTFSIPSQSLTGQWAKVGSELQLRFDSVPCVYGGQLQNKLSTGGLFNGSSTGCYYLYSGTTLSVSVPEENTGTNAAGGKL